MQGISTEQSRTGNAIKNTTISFLCQIVYLFTCFICRTAFSFLLGKEYLGVGGLFANIITILSFAELGIGNALVYRMYDPIAKQDYKKLATLLEFYRKVYVAITVIVMLLGLIILPLIPYLVTAPDVKEDVRVLFLLYLVQTVVSYVYVYKKSLFIANQKSYVINIYTQLFNIIQNIVQIIILIITKKFILYLLVSIVFNLINNIVCSARADKEYIELQNLKASEMEPDELNGLKQDVKGLLYTKIAATAYGGTDNIFITKFIGISYVGILSNYTLFMGIINGVMNRVFESITASIGNKISEEGKDDIPDVIKKLFFFNTGMYGFFCLCMVVLLKDFVTKVWLSNEYYLSDEIIFLAVLELFIRSIHYPVYITRNALGSFSEFKKIVMALAFLNIILDFLWVKPFGIKGLILSTIICRTITYLLDIYVVYNIKTRKSFAVHLKYVGVWMMLLSGNWLIMWNIKKQIEIKGLIGIIVYVLLFFVVYAFSIFLVFSKSDEYLYYKKLLSFLIKNIRKRKSHG